MEKAADIFFGESVRTCHVIVGTHSYVSITSLNQNAQMAKSADSDMLRLMVAQQKVEE